MIETSEIIRRTEAFVRETLAGAEGGHDWWHVHRVRNLALQIGAEEQADLFVVELAALLHDIADPKFHDGDEEAGPRMARDFLRSAGVAEGITGHVVKIIENVSFKGGLGEGSFRSPELDTVQDADRLDALGAIGIARTFNYGGHKGREMYNPDISPQQYDSVEAYRNSTAPTINHFYEKLLLLKERMNTATGRRMAEHRHRFMETFLEEFFREWDGTT
jgi:uncharacterized protein